MPTEEPAIRDSRQRGKCSKEDGDNLPGGGQGGGTSSVKLCTEGRREGKKIGQVGVRRWDGLRLSCIICHSCGGNGCRSLKVCKGGGPGKCAMAGATREVF
jgi:hypothetical protein